MPKKPLAKKRARARGNTSKAIGAALLRQKPARLPAVENRHAVEHGHAVTYELRPVECGKPNCGRLHGPYWYAYWTQGGRVRTAYIGRKFTTVSKKCPEKFRPGGL